MVSESEMSDFSQTLSESGEEEVEEEEDDDELIFWQQNHVRDCSHVVF